MDAKTKSDMKTILDFEDEVEKEFGFDTPEPTRLISLKRYSEYLENQIRELKSVEFPTKKEKFKAAIEYANGYRDKLHYDIRESFKAGWDAALSCLKVSATEGEKAMPHDKVLRDQVAEWFTKETLLYEGKDNGEKLEFDNIKIEDARYFADELLSKIHIPKANFSNVEVDLAGPGTGIQATDRVEESGYSVAVNESALGYVKRRIAELNEADAKFCEDRWDMSKSLNERNLYREQSNSVTMARQELERVLPFFKSESATPSEVYVPVPENIIDSGKYVEPFTFDNDRERILFDAYMDLYEYLEKRTLPLPEAMREHAVRLLDFVRPRFCLAIGDINRWHDAITSRVISTSELYSFFLNQSNNSNTGNG